MALKVLRGTAIAVLLVLAVCQFAQSGEVPPGGTVPLYSVHEISLPINERFENPFTDVVIGVTLTKPSGRTLIVDGFYDGQARWKVRIAPDEPGTWRYVAMASVANVKFDEPAGQFQVISSAARGCIRIDAKSPTTFQYDNGDRFFPMGDTAYNLLIQDPQTIRDFFDIRRRSRFNFVRVIVVCDPRFWLFGGSERAPDFTRFNIAAMQKLDRVFEDAQARDMNLELIVFGYSPLNVSLWSDEASHNRLIDYLVRRYAAYPNLFLWNVANEFERYPAGRYRFEPEDVEWARRVCSRIRAHDKFGHPTGVHCSHWTSETGTLRYRGHLNGPLQSVWPLWEKADDVTTFVTQNNTGLEVPDRRQSYEPGQSDVTKWQGDSYRRTWTATGWEFDAAGLEDFIADDWSHGKPVLNLEFGYQYEPGTETEFSYTTRQSHSVDSTRRKMWKIVTAGGFFAAGFASTWSGSRDQTHAFDINNWRPRSYEILYDFYAGRTQYWRMAPHLELVPKTDVCLAEPGREYVVYAPRHGKVSVVISAGDYRANWLSPRTGTTIDAGSVSGPATLVKASPWADEDDVVLHLVNVTPDGP